jgi:hypothetical protein
MKASGSTPLLNACGGNVLSSQRCQLKDSDGLLGPYAFHIFEECFGPLGGSTTGAEGQALHLTLIKRLQFRSDYRGHILYLQSAFVQAIEEYVQPMVPFEPPRVFIALK